MRLFFPYFSLSRIGDWTGLGRPRKRSNPEQSYHRVVYVRTYATLYRQMLCYAMLATPAHPAAHRNLPNKLGGVGMGVDEIGQFIWGGVGSYL